MFSAEGPQMIVDDDAGRLTEMARPLFANAAFAGCRRAETRSPRPRSARPVGELGRLRTWLLAVGYAPVLAI